VQLVSASSPSHQVLGSKPSLCRISARVRLCFGYSLPHMPLVWEPLTLCNMSPGLGSCRAVARAEGGGGGVRKRGGGGAQGGRRGGRRRREGEGVRDKP
jgi:hypothetical protein